jgi:mitochondrial fission protein ELM1
MFSQGLLKERRKRAHPVLDALPFPRVAVLIGGPNAQFPFDGVEEARLMAALDTLVEQGASLMVTCSRRTPQALQARIRAMAQDRVFVWTGEGANPYVDFLAKADAFFVTADSANMLSEVVATGRGVMLYVPRGKPGKFSILYEGLMAAGLAREFVGDLEVFQTSPVDSTPLIAAALEARYQAFVRAEGVS